MIDPAPYALTFCRVAIAFVFALAVGGKLNGWPAFKQGISKFGIIPKSAITPAAYLVVTAEATVVAMMLLGRGFLTPGFLISTLLLLSFSIALVSVLARRLRVPCNCFGTSTTPVSRYDIVRNAGLLACVLAGWLLSTTKPANLEAAELLLLGLIAVTLSFVWTRLGELARLF